MRFLAAGLLVSTLAFAQTAQVGGVDLSRGTTLLPGSTAWSDEATSLVYNPAGLGRVGRFNVWYLHERSNVRIQDNDGLWFATSIGDVAGLGLGFEWLRPGPGLGPDRAKTSLAFSGGPQQLSLGATVNWFHGGAVEALTTLDLGLQSRPLRWLSLGGLVRNLNTPSAGATLLNREWTVGVGLRPLGERVTLGVDWLIPERTALVNSRLQYTVQARIINGLRVMAGFSHTFASADPLYLHAGLGIDLEYLGYTQGVAYGSGQLNWQFAARFSADKYPSIVPQQKIAVVSLGALDDDGVSTVGALLGVESENRYLRFLRFLDEASRDPELKALVLKVEDAEVGLARADEIRSAIIKLRAAGKKVYAYVFSVSDPEYLMISACDGIYLTNQAQVTVDGLRSAVTYFGGAAQKVGIDVDVVRVGAYKNFPDQLTRSDMSEEQRETLEAVLDGTSKVLAARVKESRGIEPDAWQAMLDEGLTPARRAVERRQFDAVMTPTEFDEHLREQLPGARLARGYQPFDTRDERWGRAKRIAIVPVLGSIAGGRSSSSPFMGETTGAQTFIENIGRAADDPSVAAIVVRIDSGGGDGLASDLMYRAVLEAKKKKPVVASMGDVAASGGYYVAMGANEIVASPTTLTGSIGVFYVKPAVKRLAEQLDIHQVAISRGKLAGMDDLFEPWTEEQRAAAQRWVDSFYASFIAEVASTRGLTTEQVDAVARGRVWTGEAAKERGLVDGLGGLMDAIAIATRRAAVDGPLEVEIVQGGGGIVGSMMGAALPETLLSAQVPSPTPLPPALEGVLKALGQSAWVVEAPKVQARLEQVIEIR